MKSLFRSAEREDKRPTSVIVKEQVLHALRLLLCAFIVLGVLFVGLLLRLHEEAFVPLPDERILYAEQVALEQLGKPYVFATAGPDTFDCSGLMKYAYGAAGISLAHSTKTVANDDRYETISDPADFREGDLIFFDTVSGGGPIDHVGFWLGRNRFVHASSAKDEVIISDFDERWQERFSWAKRVI